MPKYYVKTGQLECVLSEDNPEKAALRAFETRLDREIKSLSNYTKVSEKGFDSNSEADTYFCTQTLLEKSGQMRHYKSREWLEPDDDGY